MVKLLAFIEYEIIGEGSQISTNQKRESTISWRLIGRNLRRGEVVGIYNLIPRSMNNVSRVPYQCSHST